MAFRGHMRCVKHWAALAIDATVNFFTHLSSNKALFVGIVALTIWWYGYNRITPHPFDDPRAGYPTLVFWYTIVFGLYEGAQKIVQAVQMKRDEKVQKIMQQSLESIEDLSLSIREELDRSRERDEAASQRDDTLRLLILKLLDRIDDK